MLEFTALVALALACAPSIDPHTVSALAMEESKGNPFAIGVPPGFRLSQQPVTRGQALFVANALRSRGREFDVGLMQIRTTNLRRMGVSIDSALDPCTSIRTAALILTENYRRAVADGKRSNTEAVIAALSAYNTGSFTGGLRNGYVARIALRATGRAARLQ